MSKRLIITLAGLAFFGPWGQAHAEMTVDLKDGTVVTVPVSKEDVGSITFVEKGAAGKTLVIPNDKPVKVRSATALERGRWYVIEASGVISDWRDKTDGLDALWCSAEWRCGKEGQGWNQLRIDDRGLPDLAGKPMPYDPQHVYQVRIQGRGEAPSRLLLLQ